MGQPTAEALHLPGQGEISLGEPVVFLGAGPIAVTVAQGCKGCRSVSGHRHRAEPGSGAFTL